MTPAISLQSLTDQQLVSYLRDAMRQFHNVLMLSRSPLADSLLMTAALVLDDVSPTADERGQALQMVIRWAVAQSAPGPVAFPLGTPRPYDDPTWLQPEWWRYNILRHRYLEPLHPDEFVEGARITETLIALTGMPNRDTYFAERNRAILDLGQWIRTQEPNQEAGEQLRQLSLARVYAPLNRHPDATQILAIASTFGDVIPHDLLLELGRTEIGAAAADAIERLIIGRYLQTDEAGTLWLSPVLRDYVYRRQPLDKRTLWHRRIAAYYRTQANPIQAVFHLQEGREQTAAAVLLLTEGERFVDELEADDLVVLVDRFRREQLPDPQWYQLQLLMSDLCLVTSRHERALAACREALRVAADARQQAVVYRRMGKLYEQRNQRQALDYYEQAAGHFRPTDTEFVELLKDRGWLHIEREEWEKATQVLTDALAAVTPEDVALLAQIHDAWAALCRYQRRFDQALVHGRTALTLREGQGDLLGVAKSQGNLGVLYRALNEYDNAIAMYREAMATYRKLGNHEMVAAALLNIGVAYHHVGAYDDAASYYEACIAACAGQNWYLTAVRAQANLAEVLAEQNRWDAARAAWRISVALSNEHGLENELTYYLEQFPQLAGEDDAPPDLGATAADAPAAIPTRESVTPEVPTSTTGLDHTQRAALEIARTNGRITARELMEECGVSKATATRKLTGLADVGLLIKAGNGRGVHYLPPQAAASSAGQTDAGSEGGPVRNPRAVSKALERQRVLLQQYFKVDGLAMPSIAPDFTCPLEMVVRFTATADLATFFALEARLSALLNTRVNLTPDLDHVDAVGHARFRDLRWIWRTDQT